MLWMILALMREEFPQPNGSNRPEPVEVRPKTLNTHLISSSTFPNAVGPTEGMTQIGRSGSRNQPERAEMPNNPDYSATSGRLQAIALSVFFILDPLDDDRLARANRA
jgi:hypothetical protein